ncbi:hypothetical protein V3F56_03000 [Moorellaceae bacterium AZ2]
MRVLLATGLEELDSILAESLKDAGIEVAGTCYIRDYVVETAKQKEADVVVLGLHLDGEEDLVTKVIFPLRLYDKRVILLPGSPADPETRTLVLRAIACGVYDLLCDPVNAGELINRLGEKGTLAGALSELGLSGEAVEQVVGEIAGTVKDVEGAPDATNYRTGASGGGAGAGDNKAAGEIPEDPGSEPAEELRVGTAPVETRRGGGTAPSAKPPLKSPSRGRIVTVWNPGGGLKSFAAFNIAAAAAKAGWDVALVNYDFACPELDLYFGVRQTGPSECGTENAGLATFADSVTAELALKMLRERGWGMKYLPVGSKLGYIGTPDFGENPGPLFREIISQVHQRYSVRPRLTVVNAGVNFLEPASFAALEMCDVILLPLLGLNQEAECAEEILKELRLLGVKASVRRVVLLSKQQWDVRWEKMLQELL